MQVDISPAVRATLAEGRPIVALENALIADGLPQPADLEVAQGIEDRVRASSAHPATIAASRRSASTIPWTRRGAWPSATAPRS